MTHHKKSTSKSQKENNSQQPKVNNQTPSALTDPNKKNKRRGSTTATSDKDKASTSTTNQKRQKPNPRLTDAEYVDALYDDDFYSFYSFSAIESYTKQRQKLMLLEERRLLEEQGYISETSTELYAANERVLASEMKYMEDLRDQANLESWILSGGQ